MFTIETLEYYFPPEYFAVLCGFLVFVFLFWYNEIDILIINYHQDDTIRNRTRKGRYKLLPWEYYFLTNQYNKFYILKQYQFQH